MKRILVWIILLFGGTGLGVFLDNFLFKEIRISLIFHIISFVIGLLILLLVIRISKNTGRTLAKYGRKGNIPKMDTNVLVAQGVYKYMRHPMHLGLLLFPLSIAFLIGSPSFIFIIAPVEIIFMLLMIKLIEEPEAIKKFGSQYIDYKNHLPWFCFKIPCLKELMKKV